MSRRARRTLLPLLLAFAGAGDALAQHGHGPHAAPAAACTPEHAAMGHCPPAGEQAKTVPACTPGHAAMGHCTLAAAPTGKESCTPGHAAMGHCTPVPEPVVDGCTAEHAGMGHCTLAPSPADDGCTPEHAAMGHCTPKRGLLQPREPIPALTDADRAAAFPALSHHGMDHGPARYGWVTLHRLEAWDDDRASGQAWEGSASFGGDLHRLWLRSRGARTSGRTTSSSVELQGSRAVARWWDVVAGVRHDARPAASRTRAVIGVQGIAPYMFEVSAVAWLGSGGAAAKLEAEYDLRFSNRLVLQPLVEMELNAKDDAARGTGSGLSSIEAGLRLRYEVTRRFAPYAGVAHERTFGRTADYREAAGEATRETRVVAGVRLWF